MNFDKSKLLVQYRRNPPIKRDAESKDKIGLYVYEANLELIWSNTVEMPYTEKKMNNVAYCVNKNADVFILTEIYKDNTTDRTTKKGEPNYDLKLFRIESTNEVSETDIKLSNKFLVDYNFFEGRNEEIILAGYYKNTDQKKVLHVHISGNIVDDYSVNGLFLFRINTDGEVIDGQVSELDAEALKKFNKRSQVKKIENQESRGTVAIKNLKMRDVFLHEDGSVTTVGEVFYKTITVRHSATAGPGGMGGGMGGTTTDVKITEYFEDVLVSNFDNEGNLNWMTKVPKRQFTDKPNKGLGIKTLQNEDGIFIVFLDNPKNLELSEDKVPVKYRDGAKGDLSVCKVSMSDGAYTKSMAFNSKNANGIKLKQFKTNRIVKISEDEFAVEFYKKKKEDVMIKVSLPE